MKYVYTAVFSLEPGTKDTYNIHFPDLPGCNTFGIGLEDAIKMAKDVLCLWLYDKEAEKADIPPASNPTQIKTEGTDFITAIAVDTEIMRSLRGILPPDTTLEEAKEGRLARQ